MVLCLPCFFGILGIGCVNAPRGADAPTESINTSTDASSRAPTNSGPCPEPTPAPLPLPMPPPYPGPFDGGPNTLERGSPIRPSWGN